MQNQKLYTAEFVKLCAASLLFMTSFNFIIPELNEFLTKIDGADFKWAVITPFALAALISRPLSSKLTDLIGRKIVMIIGALVCVVLGFFYLGIESVYIFILIRFIHGVSTGFMPTGAATMLADFSPPNRRGEAMGIFGLFTSLGFALGPFGGPIIKQYYGYDGMFIVSSLIALISLLLVLSLKETLNERQKFNLSQLKIKKDDFYEPNILGISIVMTLTTFTFGVVSILVPDQSDLLGFDNKGTFYLFYAGASIATRAIAGKASDKFGRLNLMLVGTMVLAIAGITIGFSNSQTMFLIGATLFGLSAGINSPTLFAWATDLAEKNYIGRAMGTLFIALELGIIIGSASTMLYSFYPSIENIKIGYCIAVCFALSAFFILLKKKKSGIKTA